MSRPPRISPADADLAFTAAQRVVDIHRHLSKFVREGMTLAQIDAEAARAIDAAGCKSCFLHYKHGKMPPFPAHTCLSVNECIVHGTPMFYPHKLKEGDLLKLDVGVFYKGWVGDAGWTYSIGPPGEQNRKLMQCGKEALRRGIPTLKPGGMWIDWARAVEPYVEKECGFKLTRGLGGHGIGFKKLHGPPFVSNVLPASDNNWPDAYERIQPGNLVAVEPMISLTTGQQFSFDKSPWPILTADRSVSVHYEADVLVTENGPRDLTVGMSELPDEVG